MKEKNCVVICSFPIGSVMKLTDLTAQQIRYYEDQQLITPERTEGNRRMYSLSDMDRLLEIKTIFLKAIILLRSSVSILNVSNGQKPVSAKTFDVHYTTTLCNRGRFASSIADIWSIKTTITIIVLFHKGDHHAYYSLLISSAKLKKKMLPLSVLCFQIFLGTMKNVEIPATDEQLDKYYLTKLCLTVLLLKVLFGLTDRICIYTQIWTLGPFSLGEMKMATLQD